MTAETFDAIARAQIWACLDRLVAAGHTVTIVDDRVEISPRIKDDLTEAIDAAWHDVRDWLAGRRGGSKMLPVG